jgi:hypothetical protein
VPPLLTRPADAPPLAIDQGYGYLFGLFPVNILHSLVHLGVGVWGVLAARTLAVARAYAVSLAVIFGVLTVMGFQRAAGLNAHGIVAGLENGLVASTTNMISARRSTEPVLEACIGVSASCPASALPAATRFTP